MDRVHLIFSKLKEYCCISLQNLPEGEWKQKSSIHADEESIVEVEYTSKEKVRLFRFIWCFANSGGFQECVGVYEKLDGKWKHITEQVDLDEELNEICLADDLEADEVEDWEANLQHASKAEMIQAINGCIKATPHLQKVLSIPEEYPTHPCEQLKMYVTKISIMDPTILEKLQPKALEIDIFNKQFLKNWEDEDFDEALKLIVESEGSWNNMNLCLQASETLTNAVISQNEEDEDTIKEISDPLNEAFGCLERSLSKSSQNQSRESLEEARQKCKVWSKKLVRIAGPIFSENIDEIDSLLKKRPIEEDDRSAKKRKVEENKPSGSN